jgi:apolipoprotein N-acyltransferase
VTGVYGLSFLAVWGSLALFSAGVMVFRRPTVRSVWVGEVFLPVLTVAVLFNIGLRQLNHEAPAARTLRLCLVQPSIPQTTIWDAQASAERFQDLLRLSEASLSNRADVLIWPESAVPEAIRYDQTTFDAITNLARQHQVWIVLCSDDKEPSRRPGNPAEADYFNSSFLVSPEGKLVERYIKRNLVIFGEYIPLERWFPLMKYFTPVQGSFTPGTHAVPFVMSKLDVEASVLICYEDIFPHLARTGVGPETDFLLNLTNDGWFGEGAAQWQHAISALFRTVENRVPLVRCCNTGLTCWVDAQGRLRQVFQDQRGTIYGPGFLRVDLPLSARGEEHDLTFYTRHGDWFGWGCVAVGLIVLGRKLLARAWA